MTDSTPDRTFLERLRSFSPYRLVLAAAGVVCVGLAGLGIVVPGLPTTVFLIVATFLFARSCPWLEERLIRNRMFAPFLGYLDGSAAMPWRAKIVTLALMWTFVAVSVWVLGARLELQAWVVSLPPLAAVVGTWFIVRIGPAPGAPSPGRSERQAART